MFTKSEETLNELGQELTLIQSKAKEISIGFGTLRKEAQSLKMGFLLHHLEEERRSLARSRGVVSLMRNKKNLWLSLGTAMAGAIFEGAITRDKLGALAGGTATFDATLRGLGETKCAVALGKRIVVRPESEISSGNTWVTWQSLREAMENLKHRALAGEELGDLDSVISKLKQGGRKLAYLGLPVTPKLLNEGSATKQTWRRI